MLIFTSLAGCNTTDRNSSVVSQEQTKPEIKEEIKVTNNNNIIAPSKEPEPINNSNPLDAGNTSSNLANGGYVATDGVWDYFWLGSTASHNDERTMKLAKMKRDGSEFQILTEDIATSINVVGDWIYYIKGVPEVRIFPYNGPIYKIRKDGTGRVELYGFNAIQMAVVGEDIYFISFPDRRLVRMNTDGSELTILIDDVGYQLQYHEGYIYYTSKINQENYMYKLNTATNSKPIKMMKIRGNYVINDDWIYYKSWKNVNDSDVLEGLYRIGLDGTNETKLFDDLVVDYSVTEDSIYVTSRKRLSKEDEAYFEYYRMNKDGTEIKEIFLRDIENYYRDSIFGVFGDYIYYWHYGDEWEDLARVKIDGTSEEILIDRLCDITDLYCRNSKLYKE